MPNGTAHEWETSWRKTTDDTLGDIRRTLQELVNRVTLTEQAVKDMRGAPDGVRNWAYLWLVAAGVGLSALCGGSGLVVSIVTLILHLAGH